MFVRLADRFALWENEMTLLLIGIVLFFGAHSVSIVNSAWRDSVVARMGKEPWQGIYSLIAIAGLVLIVWGYGVARQSAGVLYVPPLWLRDVARLLMIPVFPLLLAPYFPGRIKLVAKHPMLLAVKLWAAVHLLVNGSVADVILFGSFLVWAVMDRISMKSREQRPIPGAPASRWNDVIVVSGGLAIYVVFVGGAHLRLFGVPVGMPWE